MGGRTGEQACSEISVGLSLHQSRRKFGWCGTNSQPIPCRDGYSDTPGWGGAEGGGGGKGSRDLSKGK